MKAVDEQSVWSVVCFVVPAEYRGQGVAQALLRGGPLRTPRNKAPRWLRPNPVDKPARFQPTNTCGSGRSPCTTTRLKEVARRSPSGLSSASNLPEPP